ncbi:MAG: hypothetical protein CL885_02745, partial [Dehalococcoidia bacterium]|nr:hypothetical protein [Dehalococcoidia bacterium]
MLIPFLKQTTREHKWKIIPFMALTTILPPVEVAIVGIIYLILDSSIIYYLQYVWGFLVESTPLNLSIQRTILFFIALFAIFIWFFARKIRMRLQAITRLNIIRSHRHLLVNLYLDLPGSTQIHEPNDQIQNSVIQLAQSTGVFFMSIILLLSSFLGIIILGIAALYTSWIVTLIAMALGAFTIWLNKRNLATFKNIGAIQTETYEKILVHISQIVRGFTLIKIDGLKHVFTKKMEHSIQQDWDWRVKRQLDTENIQSVSDAFGLSSILIIVFISMLIEPLSAVSLIPLVLLFNRLRNYLTNFQTSLALAREHYYPAQTVLQITSDLMDKQTPNLDALQSVNKIKMSNVHFKYESKAILKDINLSLNEGDKVLISGQSGEGKSTLLKIITGFYMPSSGQVSYNDFQGNSHYLDFSSIAKQTFYSSNDLFIPDTTLRDFIDPYHNHSSKDILSSLQKACLTDIVSKPKEL